MLSEKKTSNVFLRASFGRQRELFNEHHNNNNNEVSLCLKYATQFTKAIKRTNSNKLRSVYNRMENRKKYIIEKR